MGTRAGWSRWSTSTSWLRRYESRAVRQETRLQHRISEKTVPVPVSVCPRFCPHFPCPRFPRFLSVSPPVSVSPFRLFRLPPFTARPLSQSPFSTAHCSYEIVYNREYERDVAFSPIPQRGADNALCPLWGDRGGFCRKSGSAGCRYFGRRNSPKGGQQLYRFR